jgi:penicillin-binding protein 2
MYSAIARSSDVYFYEVGGGYQDITGLGIERLKKYWQKFGLDQKTGIDLPGEKSGFLPDAEEKEKRTGIPWRIGDTYNVSIGQGDLMTTPIEILSYISSIATRGKFYQPHIVKKVEDDKGNLVREISLNVIRDISSMTKELEEVEKGMIETTQKPYGTAALLKNLPFVVAAKTGSAQVEWNTKINASFVGYGPVGDNIDKSKQIAIFILIENAREGSSNTIPVANDVLKWYYDNRIK